MKDTVISAKHKKREIFYLLSCFILANLLNIIAIVRYNTEWHELWSMFGYVLVITGVLYSAFWGIRILVYLIKSLLRRVA